MWAVTRPKLALWAAVLNISDNVERLMGCGLALQCPASGFGTSFLNRDHALLRDMDNFPSVTRFFIPPV